MPAASLCLRGHTFYRLGPRPVVVDLGANDGKFSAELLEHYPEARVVLVEADPFLVRRLRERFATQGNVLLYAGLIGAESREQAPFHLSQIPEGNSVHAALAASWSPEATRSIEASMIDLAGLFALARLDHVELLKVDIEGSEYDVLPTLGPELSRSIAQLSVEFHDFAVPLWREKTEACIAHLERLGYAHQSRGTAVRHGSPYFDCHFWRPVG